MITNQIVGNRVYIDIDILYGDFLTSLTWQSIKARLPGIEEYLEKTITSLRTRKSSSGNAHIEVTFEEPLTAIENLTMRAWLNDDIYRLRVDLVRYCKSNNPAKINRLWSGKWKKIDFEGEMHLCETWKDTPLTFMAAAREAWEIKKQETERSSIQRADESDIVVTPTIIDEKMMIPAAPITHDNEEWPEMSEALTPMPFETWRSEQPGQTTLHPPG